MRMPAIYGYRNFRDGNFLFRVGRWNAYAREWLELFAIISLLSCEWTGTGAGTGAAADVNAPIIGVAAQELHPSQVEGKFARHSSYIAASYVKAVESSGARVVPIPIGKSDSYYRNILRSINGVVLPGGGCSFGPGNPYYDLVKKIYTIAKELNDASIPFPILAVCLGYEFLLGVANDDANILTSCDVTSVNLPLEFVKPYELTRYYSYLSRHQYKQLATKKITANCHRWCVLPDDFNKQPLLTYNWVITTVSKKIDDTPIEFVSSVEHKKYPFFGIQFHPEKSAFEWKKDGYYNHAKEAVIANRYFYDVLLHFARQNDQKFNHSEVEDKALIYNYPVSFTPKTHFTQIYFDPDPDSRE